MRNVIVSVSAATLALALLLISVVQADTAPSEPANAAMPPARTAPAPACRPGEVDACPAAGVSPAPLRTELPPAP
ncbi:hypothetical protein [Coralloluteibacterium thermophilus]|uniref:Uncharacterized protein n=1 Tax=Coralloluteibacterium thermophilum TaxID=2707049 RepID=A0ABV9NKK9_9GAMM